MACAMYSRLIHVWMIHTHLSKYTLRFGAWRGCPGVAHDIGDDFNIVDLVCRCCLLHHEYGPIQSIVIWKVVYAAQGKSRPVSLSWNRSH